MDNYMDFLTYFEISECFINGRDMVETVISV